MHSFRPIPVASYQCTSAKCMEPSSSRTFAIPFRFLQRPLPYSLRSRATSRIPDPMANVSTCVIGPRSSKYTYRYSQKRTHSVNGRPPVESTVGWLNGKKHSLDATSLFAASRPQIIARCERRTGDRIKGPSPFFLHVPCYPASHTVPVPIRPDRVDEPVSPARPWRTHR